jgi:spermidine synthase
MTKEEWFIEKSDLNPGFGIALTKDKILHQEKSKFQDIEVFHNKLFGNVMLIDGLVMVTEKDEFVYHDMIVHLPLCVNPDAKKILVIGAGDGGVVRELVKYPVNHVDMIEIDEKVCEVARKFFPTISGELDNPKVHLKFQDGVEFVKNAEDNTYDLIIIDSTDPISVGEGLFSSAFYQDCYKILKEEGILVNQSEDPFVGPEMVKDIHTKLSNIFPVFKQYYGVIPTYPGAFWMFGFASKQKDPLKDMQEEAWRELNISTTYYTPELHKASFVLPKFVEELIKE